MGIDIYMLWDGQTEAERNAQYTGFSIVHGHVGYLREAYHGGPYATKVLVPEAFEDRDSENGVQISATVMRTRLPETMRIAKERAAKLYNKTLSDQSGPIQSFVKFVELAEKLEADGKTIRILASG